MPDSTPMTTYSGERYADPKLLRRLARVTIPARFIWGADDPVAPFGFGKIYAQAFADSRFEACPASATCPPCRHRPRRSR